MDKFNMDALDKADLRLPPRFRQDRYTPTLAERAEIDQKNIDRFKQSIRRYTNQDGTVEPGFEGTVDFYKSAIATSQADIDEVKRQQAQRRLLAARALQDRLPPDLVQYVVTGSGAETYGETLAGGSFWHSLGQDFHKATHWMGGHLGEVAGAAALIAAQAIPGVDVAVDSAEAAEAAEAFEAADEGATTATGKSGIKYSRKLVKNPEGTELTDFAEDAKPAEGNPYTKKVSRLPKTKANLRSIGVFTAGTSTLRDLAQGTLGDADPPPNQPPPPPGGGPPPNFVGEYSTPTSGNPYLN